MSSFVQLFATLVKKLKYILGLYFDGYSLILWNEKLCPVFIIVNDETTSSKLIGLLPKYNCNNVYLEFGSFHGDKMPNPLSVYESLWLINPKESYEL